MSLVEISTNLVWYWFAAAALLCIIELLMGANFFVLWLGISAALIGLIVAVYPPLSLNAQLLLFTAVALTCLLLWYQHFRRARTKLSHNSLNRRNEQYIGRTVTLLEPIVNGRGRIHIDDSFWRIEGPDLPSGTLVKIVAVDGVILKVKESAN